MDREIEFSKPSKEDLIRRIVQYRKYSPNFKKLLSFILKNPNEKIYAVDMRKILDVSNSRFYQLLNDLQVLGIIEKQNTRKRPVFFSVKDKEFLKEICERLNIVC